MARDNQKAPTPAPQDATPGQNAPTKAKGAKFSFSNLFRKTSTDKAFADKVAPSRRELEERAAKRRAQKSRVQGGLKPQPAPVAQELGDEEETLQPA
jgi:hypothetical protein